MSNVLTGSVPGSSVPGSRVTAALVAGVVCISFAAIFFRWADPVPPLTKSAVRLALSAPLLWLLARRFGGAVPRAPWRVAIVGGLAYAVHFGAWVSSLEYTTVAASTTLVTTTPLMLAVWDAIRGRRPSWALSGAIALGLVGVSLIAGSDWTSSPAALLGDALALLGAVAMAVYLVWARQQATQGSALWLSALAVTAGALFLVIAVVPFEAPALSEMPATAWYALGAAALVPQLLGHSLLTWAVRHTEPARVGMATVAEPAGSTMLAWWWLSEVPSPGTLAGCAIAITAVLWGLTLQNQDREPKKPRMLTTAR